MSISFRWRLAGTVDPETAHKGTTTCLNLAQFLECGAIVSSLTAFCTTAPFNDPPRDIGTRFEFLDYPRSEDSLVKRSFVKQGIAVLTILD